MTRLSTPRRSPSCSWAVAPEQRSRGASARAGRVRACRARRSGDRSRFPATPLVFGAYGFVWAVFIVYLFVLWQRMKRVEADLKVVSEKLGGAPRMNFAEMPSSHFLFIPVGAADRDGGWGGCWDRARRATRLRPKPNVAKPGNRPRRAQRASRAAEPPAAAERLHRSLPARQPRREPLRESASLNPSSGRLATS